MKTKHPRCWLLACWLLISGHINADYNTNPLIEPQSQSRYDSLKQQGVEYFSDISTADYKFHWNLLIYTHEGEQHLSVFDADTDTLFYQYSPHSGPLDRFIRQQLIERDDDLPLIGSVWQRGAHGEQFILLDPINNRTLYQITSSWPLSVQVCDESIVITVTGDSDSEGIPAQQTHYWYSPDSVDIRSGMSNECLTRPGTESPPPADDEHPPLSLHRFMNNFDRTVQESDFTRLRGTHSPDIPASFGGDGGIDEFMLTRNSNTSAPNSIHSRRC